MGLFGRAGAWGVAVPPTSRIRPDVACPAGIEVLLGIPDRARTISSFP